MNNSNLIVVALVGIIVGGVGGYYVGMGATAPSNDDAMSAMAQMMHGDGAQMDMMGAMMMEGGMMMQEKGMKYNDQELVAKGKDVEVNGRKHQMDGRSMMDPDSMMGLNESKEVDMTGMDHDMSGVDRGQ